MFVQIARTVRFTFTTVPLVVPCNEDNGFEVRAKNIFYIRNAIERIGGVTRNNQNSVIIEVMPKAPMDTV